MKSNTALAFLTYFSPSSWVLFCFIFKNHETVLVTPPIKSCIFLNLKSCNGNFSFVTWVQDPVGQVCFGVTCANCVIFSALFALMCAFPFDECFSFDLCFCPVLMLLLLTLQSPNKWCNFFCYHVSAFFGMLWHPSCAIIIIIVLVRLTEN